MTEKEQLKNIDERIDQSIKNYKIYRYPLGVALKHLLMYYEYDYYTISMNELIPERNKEIALKKGQDGINFAVLWLYRFCNDKSMITDNNVNEKIYAFVKELFDNAMTYSTIWDIMYLLFSDLVKIDEISENHVLFYYEDQGMEMTDRFINSPDSPDLINQNKNNEILLNDSTEVLKNLKIKRKGKYRIEYKIQDVYGKNFPIQEKFSEHLIELDDTWDLGGYLVSDFRKFYNYLKTICIANNFATFSFQDGKEYPIESCVIIKKKDDWVSELQKYSHLNIEVINTILRDLTFNNGLYVKGKKNPDVTYQPFFKLNDELFMLSTSLVIVSNFERNMWDLLSIIRPEIHSKLRNLKERKWLSDLCPFLSSVNLKTKTNVNYNIGGLKGEVDLVIVDEKNYTILLVQMKWPIGPDRIKDVFYAENELKQGVKQSERSIEWYNRYIEDFCIKLGFDLDEIKKYQIRAMVLSKNTLGFGNIFNPEIPIISERLLEWVIGDMHKKDINILWEIGKAQSYKAVENVHYKNETLSVEFAGIKFSGKNAGGSILKPWDPKLDIKF